MRPNEKSKIDQDKEAYGMELILDLEDVPDQFFTDEKISAFVLALCKQIKMQHDPRGPILWGTNSNEDDTENPKSDGISCILFIETSSIVVHAIDRLSKVFINCFSCADFDSFNAITFSRDYFKGKVVNHRVITRI